MHFPPYYRQKSWQRFFIGVFAGGVISYFILVYMYGSMYEDLLAENYELREAIINLRQQNEVLLETQEDHNLILTIQAIEFHIANEKEVIKDSLLASQLKTLMKEEISHLIGRDIDVVSASEELLYSAIENKAFTLDEVTYRFTITRLKLAPEMRIVVEAEIM
jgi:hypothetical protein